MLRVLVSFFLILGMFAAESFAQTMFTPGTTIEILEDQVDADGNSVSVTIGYLRVCDNYGNYGELRVSADGGISHDGWDGKNEEHPDSTDETPIHLSTIPVHADNYRIIKETIPGETATWVDFKEYPEEGKVMPTGTMRPVELRYVQNGDAIEKRLKELCS